MPFKMTLTASKTCLILVLVQCLPFSLGFSRVNLANKDWTIKETSTGDYVVPAKVPGSQYSALYSQGKIENPLYRDNDLKLAWLGLTHWSYSTKFNVTKHVAKANEVLLVCEGLDTFATLKLNGKVIGKADNMFKRWTYDVSDVLKKGDNELVVDFKSAVKEARARANLTDYTIPPVCHPPVQNGECHINQIRKEQCSFSWDWGPSFPTQGIWQPIYIDSFDSAILRDLAAVVSKENDQWIVKAEVFFDVAEGNDVNGYLQAAIPGLNLVYSQDITISSSKNSYKFEIAVPKETIVPLWWPYGYGAQPLFSLDVKFKSGQDMTSKSIRIGFKTVELVEVPVEHGHENEKKGLTFYFKVNGIPIFLKGTNWIPADSFLETITRERLHYLLSSAVDVGINSMRVWGGGIYEFEDLYDICDELGILIWQDFMFSVAFYPTYPQFIESVSEEVTYQVRRLKHHASLLVWAGNNENEKALAHDWFHVKKDYQQYYNDYIKLYVSTILPIVKAEDPTRAYLSSSPTDGAESVRQGYVAKDPGSQLYGDIHYYDYDADQWDASVFRIPRMASEYGIQAWCDYNSLNEVFAPTDLDVDSQVAESRQHHGKGHEQMLTEVSTHLKLPNTTNPQSYFEEFIYLTQINQAMSIKTQTEHYRRFQSHVHHDGRGLTMGALYWQLNDIWQAPTWASIDYEGRWKMLHYYARSFFSKHLISPFKSDKDTVDVYIVVDEIPIVQKTTDSGFLSMQPMTSQKDIEASGLTQDEVNHLLQRIPPLTKGQLKIDIYNYKKFKPIHSWSREYHLKTSTAKSVFRKSIDDLISDSGCQGPSHCFLYFTATDQAGNVLSTNWFTLTYPKHAVLQVPNFKIQSINQKNPHEFDIVVSSDVPALFVWLSAGDIVGRFSDNGFLMVEPNVKLQFFAQKAVTVQELWHQLKIRSVV